MEQAVSAQDPTPLVTQPLGLGPVQGNAANLKPILPQFIAAASPESQTVPYYPGLDYGIGVDTPSGTALNVAVTGDPSPIKDAGGSILDYYMNEVTSEEDLHTALGISAWRQRWLRLVQSVRPL